MNDVHIIHVFSCVDKLIDLQTDHSPSHNIHARGVRLENVTMVTKLIPSLKNSRIATVKKWVSEERRGGTPTRRLFQKVLIFPSFRTKDFLFGFDRLKLYNILVVKSIR